MPESCAYELPTAGTGAGTLSAATDTKGSDASTCAFEEDCIACASVIPTAQTSATVLLMPVAVADSSFYISSLDGAVAPPYRPPRF